MPIDDGLHVVEDPHDGRELAAHVTGLADRAAGRAVCHMTPGINRPVDLAAELLVCIGKRYDALRVERAHNQAWQLVDVWLRAERVQHLFVLRAQHLGASLAERLAAVGRQAGVGVWLIAPEPCHVASLHRRWTPESFLARWGDDGQVAGAAKPGSDTFPEVPSDNFPTFRASCRRILDPGGFEHVDAIYRQSMDDTAAWLTQSRRNKTAVDEVGVAAQLHSLLSNATCANEALVRLRGAQAAYFLGHWHIDFEPAILNPHSGLPQLAPTLDAGIAMRLRRLCTPRSTAALALHLVADLRSRWLQPLNVGDIKPDGTAVTLQGHTVSIPPHAASLVTAQVFERQNASATAADPLFLGDTGERCTIEALRNNLRRTSRRVGIAIGARDTTTSPRPLQGWLASRGIKCTPLDPLRSLFI